MSKEEGTLREEWRDDSVEDEEILNLVSIKTGCVRPDLTYVS